MLDGGVLFAKANAKAKATVNAKAEAKARPKAKAKGKAKTKAKRSEKGRKNTGIRKGRKRVDTRVREGRQQIRKRDARVREGRQQNRDFRFQKTLRTLNVQRPWAQLLIRGDKPVEVRTYRLVNRVGEDFYVEETVGQRPQRGFENGIVGTIRFKGDFKYTSYQHFRDDESRHCIPEGSAFDWDPSTGQDLYGWEVDSVERYVNRAAPAAVEGVVGAKALQPKVSFVRNDSQSAQ